jgi:hypothetical protein
MNNEATEFKDKQGKVIHTGDLVQVGLGISDRQLKRVINVGKHVKLVNPDDIEGTVGSYKLTADIAARSVIIDRAH